MKKIVCIVLSTLMFILGSEAAFADGEDVPAVSNSVSPSVPYSYVLMEGSTGTLLYSDNGNALFRPFHASKLMTLLLLCEAMDRGELSADSVITVSKNANSQQGAQIWLDTGEQILLDELIMAITVGNANDAAVAIAEAVGGTEENFVSLMNLRAAELGMVSTYYADPTGVGDGSVTTACDTAILASALSKYDFLTEYMTTWMTYVRGGKAELVSTNRLIRSYSGITGMKAYSHEECGNCLVASAKRGDMTMICVIFGEPDEYERFNTAKEKMNIGFSAYTLYQPKRNDIFLEDTAVSKGVDTYVKTDISCLEPFVIRTGREDDIEISTEYFSDITAPLEAGSCVGKVIYTIDDEEIYSADIVSASEVKRINLFYAFLKAVTSIFAG